MCSKLTHQLNYPADNSVFLHCPYKGWSRALYKSENTALSTSTPIACPCPRYEFVQNLCIWLSLAVPVFPVPMRNIHNYLPTFSSISIAQRATFPCSDKNTGISLDLLNSPLPRYRVSMCSPSLPFLASKTKRSSGQPKFLFASTLTNSSSISSSYRAKGATVLTGSSVLWEIKLSKSYMMLSET